MQFATYCNPLHVDDNTYLLVLLRYIGPDICQHILFLHAVLGCDTTYRLHVIGQGASLNKYQTNNAFRQLANGLVQLTFIHIPYNQRQEQPNITVCVYTCKSKNGKNGRDLLMDCLLPTERGWQLCDEWFVKLQKALAIAPENLLSCE